MLVHNKKEFIKGTVLLVTFIGIVILLFSPIFPGDNAKKENGLSYIDNIFNKLSKGSSNFLQELKVNAATLNDQAINITCSENHIKDNGPDEFPLVQKISQMAGMNIKELGANKFEISGNLHNFLNIIITDSELMFNNNGTSIQAKYNLAPKEVMFGWSLILNSMTIPLKRERLIKESNVVGKVLHKGVEPAFNFYGINAIKVTDHALLLAGALIFYIIYTFWYGFGVMHFFQGIGLSMTRGKGGH